jgi:argininosuccinate lyase
LRLSDIHVTGSSIMPNKRNPDFAEVTRARAQAVHSLVAALMGVGRGALSGYNRDTQWTKYWIMDLVEEVGAAPEVFAEVVAALEVNKPELAKLASEGFSLAADFADHLARTRKIPFRKAYHVVAEAVAVDERQGWFRLETVNGILAREGITPPLDAQELAATGDPAQVLKGRASLGAPQPEQVREQAAELERLAAEKRRWAAAKRRALEAARSKIEQLSRA